MLVRERLPELGADLVAALADLQCHNLAHLDVGFVVEREGGREEEEARKRPGGGQGILKRVREREALVVSRLPNSPKI